MTLNIQNNLGKEEQTRRYRVPQFQTIPQSYSKQNSVVLMRKQTRRSMEQNREISPHSQGQLIYCRGRKDILCGKTGFLIKVLGKAGSYMPSIRLDHFLVSYTKANTKWSTDFNVSLEIIRLPEENRHWSQQSYFRYVSSGKREKMQK